MFRISYATVLVACALTTTLSAAEWRLAKGPLQTRWADQVRPETALPEYPRPQMERKDWLNLNGLWQLELGVAADAAPPYGRDLPETILVPFPIE